MRNILLLIGLCLGLLNCGFSDVPSGPYTPLDNNVEVCDATNSDSLCIHDQVMEDIYNRFNVKTWNDVYGFLKCGKLGSSCINFPAYTQERIADYIIQAACCPFKNPKTTTQSKDCIECVMNNITVMASHPNTFNTGLANLIKDCK